MERIRFIEHRGRRILLFDFSGFRDTAEAVQEIRHAMEVVRLQPPGSLLVLTDVSDSRYDQGVVQAMKELAAHNAPYVRASAVVGVEGLRRVVYSAVILFSKRKIHLADTREQALDWLVGQDPGG